MKITIVVGGRWHAFYLARELDKRGHLYRLITNYPRWVASRWGVPKEKIVSIPITFLMVKLIYKIGGEHLMMRCQWIVHRLFADQASRHLEGSELIHGWSSFSEPSINWALRNNVPFILERSSAHILTQSRLLHEAHDRLGMLWVPTHPKVEQMEVREYELCDRIAVPSQFVERSFLERGFPANKLFRNQFGVDAEDFCPSETPPPAPTEIPLRVVYAGALSVQKGVHELLRGFSLAGIESAELVLLGGRTKELARILDVQPDCVKELGHRPQSDLVGYYQRSHCFVMPSIQEGMAMVQLQALACGLPLICTTNSGGEDLIEDSSGKDIYEYEGVKEFDAGFVVPINDPQAIAYCLRRLANDNGLWKAKREAAIARACSGDLSWVKYTARALELYKSIAAERRS